MIDANEGFHPAARNTIESMIDVPLQVQPQHYALPRRIRAVCGERGPIAFTRAGVTCIHCRAYIDYRWRQ